MFAAVYLAGELAMRLFSTIVVAALGWSWTDVFLGYTVFALASTLAVSALVTPYDDTRGIGHGDGSEDRGAFQLISSTLRLLSTDYRIKYTVPICGVFALTSSFLTSYVNGEVLPLALHSPATVYVGLLGSVTSATAAVASLLFARLSHRTGNNPILVLGCAAFALAVLPSLADPTPTETSVPGIVATYALVGVGRAAYEGNLRAELASGFGGAGTGREGAFGNVVLWTGLFSVLGFGLFAVDGRGCEGGYCVEYRDGTEHGVLGYEVLVLLSAVLAIGGLLRVDYLKRMEEERVVRASFNLDERYEIQ